MNYKLKNEYYGRKQKKHYVTPSMKVYEIEPTQLLAGSNEDTPTNTSVNDWNEGGSLGAHEI